MADDIYFNSRKENIKKDRQTNAYTEKINADELNRRPGDYSFGDIVTERGKITATVSSPKSNKPLKNSGRKKKKKSKGTAKKVLTALLCTVIALFIFAGVTVSYVLSDYEEKEFSENVHIEDDRDLLSSPLVYNILLLGIDTLETESSSRSDAMIIMSIDSKNGQIKLSSFLRDSYVYIPGYGNMKLNAACVYGGPQLVCDTIEYNFGIRIDDYAKVGYDMFIKIIDAVGGVTIPEIDEIEASALAKEGFITEPGTDIELDGVNALKYCRIRKGQDDFYRTGRQREVISLVLKKLPLSNPFTLLKTAKEIASTIECSIGKGEFFSLLMKAVLCLGGDIEQLTVPADGTWYNDTKNYQAVLVVDFSQNKEKLAEFLYN